MKSAKRMAIFSKNAEYHEKNEKPQGSLGCDQVKPVKGRRNRMEPYAALNPFVLHDDRSGNIASEPRNGRQNVSSSYLNEVRDSGL